MSNLLQRATVRKTAHYHCRNPHCRSRLPHPAENERHAFCCSGCYARFYRSRCAVCEKSTAIHPLTGKRRGNRTKFCGRKCKGEAARFPRAYSFPKAAPAPGYTASPMDENSPLISRAKIGDLSDRPRPKSVGPKMSATSYYLATLPLDPETAARIERANALAMAGRKTDSGPVLNAPVLSRWKPSGDPRDMPDLPPFLVRR